MGLGYVSLLVLTNLLLACALKLPAGVVFPVFNMTTNGLTAAKLLVDNWRGLGRHDSAGELTTTEARFLSNIGSDNKVAMDTLVRIVESKVGWKHVNTKDGVVVEKMFLPAGPFVDRQDALKGSKHACVKSSGIINASPSSVYKLFLDNSRVKEYNEHCVELKDVTYYRDKSSKVSWARSPNYGPFKPRDFCSIVYYTKKRDGSYVILNRPAYVPSHRINDKYVRATVLLAGNIILPHGNGKCKLVQVAHVNPGGGADNKTAAWIINKLCGVGPPTFIRNLEKAAQRE